MCQRISVLANFTVSSLSRNKCVSLVTASGVTRSRTSCNSSTSSSSASRHTQIQLGGLSACRKHDIENVNVFNVTNAGNSICKCNIINGHVSISKVNNLPFCRTNNGNILLNFSTWSTYPHITYAKSIISTFIRHLSYKRTTKENAYEDEDGEASDNNDDDDSSDDDDENLTYKEDEGFPSKFKEVKVHMKSLRLDSVIGGGLNIARNKIDDYFLESKLQHNGEKVLKKSKKVFVGDCVDLIVAIEDEKLKVKRVRVLKVENETTSGGRLKVHLRVWRNGVMLNSTEKSHH